MASNSTSISHFISTAKDLDDLRYIDNYFTSHSIIPLSLEKNALCDLQRLYDSVFNSPVSNLDHQKGFLGFVKCLQQFSFETDDGQWQPEHENFMYLINKSTNYINAHFEKGGLFKDSFDIILDVIINISKCHQTLKTKMLQSLSPTIFDIVIKNTLTLDLLKKCLTALTNLVTRSELGKRKEVMEFVYPKLCKFFDQLYACGDFDTQLCIVETLLRYIVPDKNRKLFFFYFKRKDPELIKNFLNIRSKDFDVDCRLFLNYINRCQGERALVLSIPCFTILLDDIRVEKPPEQELFWIDFNKRSQSVSIWCSKNSLLTADEQKISEYLYATDWQSIVIYPDIVSEVSVKSSRSQSSQQQSFKEVIFFLKENIIIRPLSYIKSSKSKRIHIIFPKSQETEDLDHKILPQLFHMKKSKNDELQSEQEISVVMPSRSKEKSRHVSEVKATLSINHQSKLQINDTHQRNMDDGSCIENKVQRRRRKVSNAKTTIEFQSCIEQISSLDKKDSLCAKSNHTLPASSCPRNEDILTISRDSNDKATVSLPKENILHHNSPEGDVMVSSKSNYRPTLQLDLPEKLNISSKVFKNKFADRENRRVKISESVDKCTINLSNSSTVGINAKSSKNLAVNKENESIKSQEEVKTIVDTNLISETVNEHVHSNLNKMSHVEDDVIEDDKYTFPLPNQSRTIKSKRSSTSCTSTVKKNSNNADYSLEEVLYNTRDDNEHKENIHCRTEMVKNNSEKQLICNLKQIPENNLKALGTCILNRYDILQNNASDTCQVPNKIYLSNVGIQKNLLVTDRKVCSNISSKTKKKGQNITDNNVSLEPVKNVETNPENSRIVNDVNEFAKSNPTSLERHVNVPINHKSIKHTSSLCKNLLNSDSSVVKVNNDMEKEIEAGNEKEFSQESGVKNQIKSKKNKKRAREIETQQKRNHTPANNSLKQSRCTKCPQPIVDPETMSEETGKRYLRSSNKLLKKPLNVIINKKIENNKNGDNYESKENNDYNCLENDNIEENLKLKYNENTDFEQIKDLVPKKCKRRVKSTNIKAKNDDNVEDEQKLRKIIPNLRRSNRKKANEDKLCRKDSRKRGVRENENNEREILCPENKSENEILTSSNRRSVIQFEANSERKKNVIVNGNDKFEDHKNSTESCEILTEDKKTCASENTKLENAQCSSGKNSKKLHGLRESEGKSVTNIQPLCEFDTNKKDFVTEQCLGCSNSGDQQETVGNISDTLEQSISNRIGSINMKTNTSNLVKNIFGTEQVNLCLNDRLDHLKTKESLNENNKVNGFDSKCSDSIGTLRETSPCKNKNKNNDESIVSKHNTLDKTCEKQDERNDTNAKMVINSTDKDKSNVIPEEVSKKNYELHPNSSPTNAVHSVTRAIVHANPDYSVPSSEDQSSNNNASAVITTSVKVFEYFSQSVMSVEKTFGRKSKSPKDCGSHKIKKTSVGDKHETVTEETLTNKVESTKALVSTSESMNDFKSIGNVYISNKKVTTKSTDKVTKTKKRQISLPKQDASYEPLNGNLEKNLNNERLSSARSLRKRKAVSYVLDSPINDVSSPILKKEKYSTKENKTIKNISEKPRKSSVKRKLFTQNQVDIISLCSASQSSTTTINNQEPVIPEESEILPNQPQSKPLDEFDIVLASTLPPLPKKYNRWEEKYRKDKESLIQSNSSKLEEGKSQKRKHSVYSDLESDSDASFLFFKPPSSIATSKKVASHITPTENNHKDKVVANEKVVKSGTFQPNINHSPCSSTEKLLCAHPSRSPDNDASFLNIESDQSKTNEKYIETTGKKYVQDEELMIDTNDISPEKIRDICSNENDCEITEHIFVQTPATNATQLNNVEEKELKENSVYKSEKCSTNYKKSCTQQEIKYSNNDTKNMKIGKTKKRKTRNDHAEKTSNVVLDHSNSCRKEEKCCDRIGEREKQTIFHERKLQDSLQLAKKIDINNTEGGLKDSSSGIRSAITEETVCKRRESAVAGTEEVALDLREHLTNNPNNDCSILPGDRYSPYVANNCTQKAFENCTEHFENQETIKYISISKSYKVDKANKNKTSLDSHCKDNIINHEMKIQTDIEKEHRPECSNVKNLKDASHVNSRNEIDLNLHIQSSELAENCNYYNINNEHNLADKVHKKNVKNSKDILITQKNHHTEQNICVSSSKTRKTRVNTVENTKNVLSKVKQTVQQSQSQISCTFDSGNKIICSSSVSSSESSENPEDPVESSEEECTTEILPYTSGSKNLKDHFQKMVYEKIKYINAFSSHTSNALLTQLSNSSSLFVEERTSYIKAVDDIVLSNINDIQTQLQDLDEYEQFLEQKKAEMIVMINRQKLNSEVMVKRQLNIQNAYGSFVSDSSLKQYFDIQQFLSSMKESYMKKTLREMLQKCRNIFDMSP